MTTPITLSILDEERVHPSEPCFELVERGLPPPDFGAPHRYQLVQVLRGDGWVWFRKDMGLEADWPGARELRISGDGEKDSVQMLRELADEMRADPYWANFHAEVSTDMNKEFGRLLFERARRHQNISVFGPGFNKQRNGVWRGL